MGAGKPPPDFGRREEPDFGRREEAGAPTHIFTSQDFSWLQKGQVNWVSRVPVIFFLGGGFRFDFLRPMSEGRQTWGGGGGSGSQQLGGSTEPSSLML